MNILSTHSESWDRLCIAHIARGLGRPHNCPRKRWARAQRRWRIHLGDLPHMPHKDNPFQVLRIPGWVRAQIVGHITILGWAEIDPFLGPPYLRITRPSAPEDNFREVFNAPPPKTYGPSAIFCLTACDEEEVRKAALDARPFKRIFCPHCGTSEPLSWPGQVLCDQCSQGGPNESNLGDAAPAAQTSDDVPF